MPNPGAGKRGEDRAAALLEAAGLSVITRNFRSRQGEIDIIAREGETIVFTEVKSWSRYGIEELRYSINLKKQRRIIETAKYFLAVHREYNGMAVRFDVVFVGKEGATHLVSAFTEYV
ncbi:MAG: YraN family protein [Spirochaetaceae bacterium]|jgi:putative endonuclease|nr:YraN family protein [Spirochaetaceae bacterium]